MTPARMDDKVVVVTGVGRSGQVGEAVANAFASLGARCVLIDRDPDQVAARAADLQSRGGQASAHGCDLTVASEIGAVAASIAAQSPAGVHALVCLAGGYVPGSAVADTAPDDWQRLFAINLTTAFLTTRAFLPQVRKARGSIVYFASAAALPGARVSGMAAYGAAKTGVVTLMRAVAGEEREHGVRANALAPTSIRTASNIASMGADASYVERETVADWVVLLSSEAAAAVTGQVIKLG